VACALATRHPRSEVIAVDNLRRRGSELNLPRLRVAGVRFEHADVRDPVDLDAMGPVDAIVECSAEPSALAGRDGSTSYVVDSNLGGAHHCLELARRYHAAFVFLSTSRVYPVATQRALQLEERETRFELAAEQPVAGASEHGIAEDFPLDGARTLYGATKLAAELLVSEYRDAYGVSATVNRCGVIAGPWQMGRVDQGVFSHWVLAHHFGRPLTYIGFGGTGKQVRDLLHVDDVVDLVELQLLDRDHWDGFTANVSGGRDCSLSLVETTSICQELTGNEVEIGADPTTRPGDVPVYLGDCSRLFEHTSWRPTRGARRVLADIHSWVADNEEALAAAL
jgi:CDP-paratose 2-epimerase